MDAETVARFVQLALGCVHKEFPNKISHTLDDETDVRPPRALTPAFYGCYDWHSAVHAHWLLARAARLYPDAAFAPAARGALDRSLTDGNIAGEVAYLQRAGRAAFERPYGLAWVLRLAAELHGWDDPEARDWARALSPLESEAASRLASWLPKLRYPIRTGEHNQTAFACGLALDWADVCDDTQMRKLIDARARRFYLDDRNAPLGYEPSGEDFLSPCLAEADLMRRVLERQAFAYWLAGFLPGIPSEPRAEWLMPVLVSDRSDAKLAHLDGLNLSRAWMLEGIAHGLGDGDQRVAALLASAAAHRAAALPAVTAEHYEGAHWLGTFAVYLVSGAGVKIGPAR